MRKLIFFFSAGGRLFGEIISISTAQTEEEIYTQNIMRKANLKILAISTDKHTKTDGLRF